MNLTRIYELLASAVAHARYASARTRRMVQAALAAYESLLLVARVAA